VALLQNRVVINIDFAEGGTDFAQERGDRGLGFVAKVASGTRVKCDVAWTGGGEPSIFGMSAHRFSENLHLTGEQARLGRTRHNIKAAFAKRCQRKDGAKWEES